MRLLHRARRFAADRSGSTAIEMGILFTMLLTMMVGAIYAGWLLWSGHTLMFAVEEASRCAAIDAVTCGTPAAVQSYAASHAIGLGMAASDFTVTTNATCAAGVTGMKVQASYSVNLFVPFVAPTAVSIPASSCYPLNPS